MANEDWKTDDDAGHGISSVRFTPTMMVIDAGKDGRYRFRLATINPVFWDDWYLNGSWHYILLSGRRIGYSLKYGVTSDEAATQRVIDALKLLKRHAQQPSDDEAQFAMAVDRYRSASPRPRLPDDALQLKRSAETAVQQLDFEGAAALYEQALDLAPWWADGHFNRGIVLAELGEFAAAAREMKRYVALAPNAPDVGVARERSAQWEQKAS